MSKVGVNFKIDVTKLDKSRFFVGKKGTYADLTVFVDSEPSQFGDNGMIVEQSTKEERDQGIKLPKIGNATIFWSDAPEFQQPKGNSAPEALPVDDFDDDVPF